MSKPDDESQDRPRRSSDGHKRPRGSGHGPRTQRGERSFGDRSRGGKGFQRSDRRRDDRRDGQRWDNRRDDRRGGKDFRRDERRGGKDFRRDERRGGKDFRRAERKRNDRERGGTRRERRHEPPIPEGITGKELHSETRRQLRPLEKSNADVVAKHLVAAGQLVDAAPEVAYEHAQAALGRAARIGAVREAVGIVAYQLEKYGEALRELRTHRRITGSNDNAALMADCERGRGNPRKALEVAAEFEAAELDPAVRIELLIVKAGAYSDLGDNATAKEILSSAGFTGHPAGATVRLLSAYADLLRVDGETELADKYEQLARRTAKLKNVMYGDEEPDPNADVEIMTIHEIPDEELAEPVADGADENEDPAPGEDPEAGDAAAWPATASGAADEAPSSEESDGTAAEGTAAHDAEPAEAPAAEPEQPVAANLSFEDEVEAELQELLIEAGIEPDAGTQPDGGEEPPQEETLF
ncbi:hypothetical protein [Brevibacterium otitidis]|uniref:Tetratricopeptide repeat-containing protein n=1 Tax=Brevibacterium otitidis TaxID=53364 RepID=A0ABV5X259_9MICO